MIESLNSSSLEEQEQLKKKYRMLLNDLTQIKNQLNKLTTSYHNILKDLDENIQIDNKMFDEDELTDIEQELNDIKYELNYNLINKITSKI